MKVVYTIGYEGADLADFIWTLRQSGVEHVLDVRELPQSRRRGFSKNILASALADAEIGYSHLKQLGDPKHGREAARRGDMAEFHAIFEAHMDLPASQAALRTAAETVSASPTALLCYERDPKHCHRSLVVKRLMALNVLKVQHLGVVEDGGRRPSSTGEKASGHA